MREEAQKKGADYEINAYSMGESDKFAPEADVILVGPQIRFALNNFKKKYPNKPIEAIDMRAYGMMDGKAVLAVAEKLLAK
jgi:PTS system cellobiose-specific IIB component